MQFTIEKTNFEIIVKEDKSEKKVPGFAFVDMHNRCILITYGEFNVKNWAKILL